MTTYSVDKCYTTELLLSKKHQYSFFWYYTDVSIHLIALRLDLIFFCDRVFRLGNRLLLFFSNRLNEVTRAKIIFIKDKNQLQEYIDPEFVPADLL